MDTFIKTALAVACLFLIVPLAVWANTGSLRHAWHALKGYMVVLTCITIPGVCAAAVALLSRLY